MLHGYKNHIVVIALLVLKHTRQHFMSMISVFLPSFVSSQMALTMDGLIFHKICATDDIGTIPGRFGTMWNPPRTESRASIFSISSVAQILWKLTSSAVNVIWDGTFMIMIQSYLRKMNKKIITFNQNYNVFDFLIDILLSVCTINTSIIQSKNSQSTGVIFTTCYICRIRTPKFKWVETSTFTDLWKIWKTHKCIYTTCKFKF